MPVFPSPHTNLSPPQPQLERQNSKGKIRKLCKINSYIHLIGKRISILVPGDIEIMQSPWFLKWFSKIIAFFIQKTNGREQWWQEYWGNKNRHTTQPRQIGEVPNLAKIKRITITLKFSLFTTTSDFVTIIVVEHLHVSINSDYLML